MADISKEEQMIAAKALAAQKAAAIASQKQADKLAKAFAESIKDLRKSNKDLLTSVGKDWAAVADKQGKTGAERDKIIKEGQEQFLHKQATVLHEHRKKEAEARQKARDDARVEQLKNEKMAKSGLPEELAKDLAKKEVAAEKREEERKKSQGGIFQMLRNIHDSGKQSLEERFEENKAKKQGAAELKIQGGFLAGIFANTEEKKKDEKKGGILGFLKDHWGKILLGLGVALTLLLTPLKNLGKAWEKMFGGDSWTEIGGKIAGALVVALAAVNLGGALFSGLSSMLIKALLPKAGGFVIGSAGVIGKALIKAIPILAVVAAIGTAIWDGIKGANLAEQWGVSKTAGAVGGILAGTGKGIGNAFKNAGKWAVLGAAIGSVVPVVGTLLGGIIGAVVGGILGYFGGEKVSGWIQSAMDGLSKLWDRLVDGLFLMVDDFRVYLIDPMMGVFKKMKKWAIDAMNRILPKRVLDFFGISNDPPVDERTQDELEEQSGNQSAAHDKRRKEVLARKIAAEKEAKALARTSSAAVSKGDIVGMEAEREALSAQWSTASSKQEADKIGLKIQTLRMAIISAQDSLDTQNKERLKQEQNVTLPSGPTDLKEKSVIYANQRIQDNVRKSAAINPKLAKMVHISGGAFKHAGEQMRITSGFRNKASQAKAMEGLRLRDPKQYEKNYGMDAKNDSSTDEWLKKNASRHQSGNAIDISYPKGVDRKTILKSLNKRLRGVGYAMGEGDHIHINTGLKGIKPAMEEITAFEDKFENFKPASAPDDRTGAMNAMQTENLEGNRQAAAPIIVSPTQVSTVNNSNSGSTTVLTGSGAGNSARIDQR